MKSIILSFLLIFTLHQIGLSQWEEINISTAINLSSVHFLNEDTGFVVGGNKIFKTTDGGMTWETSFTAGDLFSFEDVLLVDENKVFAVGKNFDTNLSVIANTKNNGDSWTLVDVASTSFLSSIFFSSPTTAYCSGSGGVILKSTDAGESWETLDSGTSAFLQSIYFVNDLVGMAVGGGPANGLILKTQDGGLSWNPVSSPSNNYFQSVFFVEDQIGYIVGWNGEILKTEDCGSTWIIQNSVAMNGNLEVTFTDANTGYIVGGSSNESLIQKTENGGDLWEDISPDISAGLIGVYFPSFEVGYAVGANGTVVKTKSGGVLTSTNNLFSKPDFRLFPNPTSNRVSIESLEKEPILRIRIFDETGKLIGVKEDQSTRMELDFLAYPAGVYYLECLTENRRSISKLVKK